MKKLLPIILILLSSFAFGQELQKLNDYISKIDNSVFTDSIYLEDIQLGKKVSIQGFTINDSIVKAIINYSELNRTRIVYYKNGNNFLNDVCYVKEFDSKKGTEYIKIKSWDNKILESEIINAVNDDEKKNPKKILERSDFTTVLEFKRIDDKADKYTFSGKLVELVPLPAYCGTFAWATAFKFEIINTEFETKEKYLIVIITCPSERGKEFYEVEKTYKGLVATNSGVTFGWALQNNYEQENLPTFWAREIEKE